MPSKPRATHRAEVADALELTSSGLGILQVARKMGVTPKRAHSLLQEALAGIPGQGVDEIRALTEARLDLAAQTFGEILATETDARVRTQAANGLLAVERDRSRLLGLWIKPEPYDDEVA